ncbi:MAG: ORF6N domain-containing protein [bacterium]|nr:ORF6N domain-containing protein [bacterium]
MSDLIPAERIESKILLIRGPKVMLDRDLAELYGVTTKRLNEQVRRNIKRFPEDFMFQLTKEEVQILRSQNATAISSKSRTLPYVFTEQGVAMLSSVLNSERAILVNVQIMRAFTRLRGVLSSHKELAQKLSELERKVEKHDVGIQTIFEAIRQLMSPLEKPKPQIGFRAD